MERPDRLTAIVEHLEARGLRERMIDLAPRDASEAEVLAVHVPELLTQIVRASSGSAWLDPDTYTVPESPGLARRAAGAVLSATEAVLDGDARNAFVAVRPPGHHATPDRAMGFCLLNNVAIAAAAALERGVARIAILDWDVHHGNGTQARFAGDPRVLYASTHQSPLYPGTGDVWESGAGEDRATLINVPLPPAAGDRALTSAYRDLILPEMERFRPELVLVSSGWDAHARDPLAMLEVSTAGFTEVARMAIETADRVCDGRLVAVLEGGYDLHALAWCSSALCELLLGEDATPDPEPLVADAEPDVTEVIEAVRRVLMRARGEA